MASDKKIIEEVGESSHDTPQAITITIMDPSALEATDLDSSLVTSVETQDDSHDTSTLLVVPGDGHASISVEHGAKNILQTVTETHMGTHELPVISNISNPEEDTREQDSIHVTTKTSEIIDEGEGVDEEDGEEADESVGQHCLICNIDLPSEQSTEPVLVFKTQTTTTQRKMSVFLGALIGQKLTSRKAHSDIMCHRCFGLLDRVDALEVEIRDTKEEIVNKYQETVAVYGGRARRRKPATAKKTDYVFPKVEPEDEDEQVLGLEMDENFEPRVEDLMEEENDHREDRSTQDEEWEPEFKKPRIKREAVDAESSGPTKRKRGRPRKDAAKPKAEAVILRKGGGADSGDDASPACNRPACPVCSTTFSFHSQLRRHIRYEHPNFGTNELECSTCALPSNRRLEEIHMELEEDGSSNDMPLVYNLSCSWCELEFDEKEAYDEHLDEHSIHAYQQYLVTLEESEPDVDNDDSITVFKSDMDESIQPTDLENVKHKALKNSDENSNTSESKGNKVALRSNRNITEDTPGYKCEFCGLMNSSKVNLEYHLDKCHEGVARHCGLCYELCLDAVSLRSHLVHHYNGVLVCPVCPIRFSIRFNLTAHLDHCHQHGYVVSCGECKAEFTNYDSYEAHQAHKHGRGALRTCEICDKEILAVDIDKHMKSHEDSEIKSEALPHTCNLCNTHFSLTTQLYHHKYRDHPDAFNFKCDECERRFRTERTLTAHKWGHRYGSHQCPACRLKYRQVDQLKRHLLSVHPEFEGYNCKFCSTTLKNYSTYVAHLKFKHPKEAGYDKRPVRCKLCGESFAHKVQWKYHMRNHTHSLQTCEICGITVKNLEIHMNLHTKEKKFECGDCGAVYHNKASFHFHVKRVHMGEEVRKHMCAICQKGFLTPADLRIHMSRVHRGERNYWCTTCNKGYKSKVSLTYHERLHTGERPHQCTMCGRSFRVPSYLKRHMEHDHRAQYTGVYYKQGRPKSQEQRSRAQRHHPHRPSRPEPVVSTLEETVEPIPEIVQITVPMEMGGEVISAVGSTQDLGRAQHLELEQNGVVYVVYEN